VALPSKGAMTRFRAKVWDGNTWIRFRNPKRFLDFLQKTDKAKIARFKFYRWPEEFVVTNSEGTWWVNYNLYNLLRTQNKDDVISYLHFLFYEHK